MERRAEQRDRLVRRGTLAPLFVPADRPDRVRKATARGAPVIIIDLEDAVPAAEKAAARAHLTQLLLDDDSGADTCRLVRVNPVDVPRELDADLEALRTVADRIDGIVLPKVTAADHVRLIDERVAAWTGIGAIPLIATIETATGLRDVWNIAAASPTLYTLMFGVVDLCADLGITATVDGIELLTARSLVVHACSAAGLAKPIDGPYLKIADPTGLTASAQHARQLGFGGKVVIHPDQLAAVVHAFAPTADEVQWANQIVAAFEEAEAAGVGVLRTADGTFIDAPVVEQARRILRRAVVTGVSG